MVMHCSMDDLIAVRDGEGTDAMRWHLDACEACRDELERVHQRAAALRALPAVRPPRDRWTVVRDRVVGERVRARRRWAGLAAVAAAASVLVSVGVGRLAMHAGAGDHEARLLDLAVTAQALEADLEAFDPAFRVMNGRTAGMVAAIEDELTRLDRRFADVRQRGGASYELVGLMEDRVRLMNTLVNVQRGPAVYVGF